MRLKTVRRYLPQSLMGSKLKNLQREHKSNQRTANASADAQGAPSGRSRGQLSTVDKAFFNSVAKASIRAATALFPMADSGKRLSIWVIALTPL